LKIDAFTHILPREYGERMSELGDTPAARNIRNRIAGIPALIDLDVRLRQLEEFGDDYRQIISLPAPPLEDIGDPALARDMARLANEGLARIVEERPERFAAFVAALPLGDVDHAIEEARHAVRELGAAGVQIYTNVGGLPWDEPRFEPFFDAIAELDAMIWVHPNRNVNWADYPTEDRSRYEIWWALGWPHETSLFMARIVFSGLFDRHPDLKILTHHGGGTVPYLAGRVASGWDQLGARTPEAESADVENQLKHRPLDYFKLFYADTALFGAPPSIAVALDFFGHERILFASDSPFDPERGPGYIRTTIADLEGLGLGDEQLGQIFAGNARRLLRLDRSGANVS
jgi:predicted TIM-barrel fold metal-dependent hydrolase